MMKETLWKEISIQNICIKKFALKEKINNKKIKKIHAAKDHIIYLKKNS